MMRQLLRKVRMGSAKIGMVSQWYDPERGSAAQSGVIARSLIDLGHRVGVVTGFPNYPTGDLYPGYRVRPYATENRQGVQVHRAPLYPSHDANALRRSLNYLSFAVAATAVAVRTLRDADVCLVYATPATAAIPAMALRWVHRVPYVVHVHDLWPDSVLASGFLRSWQNTVISRVLHAYCDAMYRRAAAVAVTSPGMAERLVERGVPSGRIAFIPNWADEDVFGPTEVSEDLRQELGIGADLTVMYAGNLGEYQDLHTVVEAACLLRHHSDIEFVFVGEGVERESLERRAQRHDLSNVRFLGARTLAEMPQILALGDLQLVTLKDLEIFDTTLPSKLVATLASGRPVLGGLTGDAADLVRRSGAGEVCTPGAPEQLAEAVLRFSALRPAQRQQRGQAGRQYYVENLGRASVAGRLSRLLERVAAGVAA